MEIGNEYSASKLPCPVLAIPIIREDSSGLSDCKPASDPQITSTHADGQVVFSVYPGSYGNTDPIAGEILRHLVQHLLGLMNDGHRDDIERAYQENQRELIEAWKAEVPGVVSRVINAGLSPVTWVVERIVPKKTVQGILSASNAAANLLAVKDQVLTRAGIDEIRKLRRSSLRTSDEVADWIHNWAIAIATAEGGATGAAGILAAPVDIPAVVTLALWAIHSVGLCYGFEATTVEDNEFVFGVLAVAGANSIQEKTAALTFLRSMEVMIAKQSWKKMAETAAQKQFTREGAIITIRALAKQLGINLTKRRVLAAIPIVGAVIGAAVNGDFLKDVGWAARRSFQERWLAENDNVP